MCATYISIPRDKKNPLRIVSIFNVHSLFRVLNIGIVHRTAQPVHFLYYYAQVSVRTRYVQYNKIDRLVESTLICQDVIIIIIRIYRVFWRGFHFFERDENNVYISFFTKTGRVIIIECCKGLRFLRMTYIQDFLEPILVQFHETADDLNIFANLDLLSLIAIFIYYFLLNSNLNNFYTINICNRFKKPREWHWLAMVDFIIFEIIYFVKQYLSQSSFLVF